MKVAVVTPTIGSEHLKKCLDSVQKQTYDDITHYIFLDGENNFEKINSIRSDVILTQKDIKTIKLQENVGKGWYGHRVYAACSFLVNADIICYLDEDNWYEQNHVEKIVETIRKGYEWAFSFRKIFDKQGNFLCEDNCESLGKWPVYFDGNLFHIDTSSFGVRRDVAVAIGHAWYGQWGADRQFFTALKKYFPNFESTKEYSMCYRLDGNPNSVTEEFFKNGNAVNTQKYNGVLPWKTNQNKINIAPGITVTL